jgi:hypothetical protein
MKVPYWGQYMMLIASAIGTYLLFVELNHNGWPSPFKGH